MMLACALRASIYTAHDVRVGFPPIPAAGGVAAFDPLRTLELPTGFA